MPRAIPYPIRQEIIARHLAGQSLTAIAQQLQLSYRSVRTLAQHYRTKADAGLLTNYTHCGSSHSTFPVELFEAAITLKREHPGWGAGLIQLQLRSRFPTQALPSWRSLQRWWKQAGLARVRQPRASAQRTRGQQPHEVWQLDAKERIRLQDGSWSSVVSVVDEASGALLSARAFPPQLLVASASQCGAGLDAPGLW